MCESSFYTRTQEPYEFLLLRRDWKAKRERILIRDNHTCQKCGRREGSEVHLHVHHSHYIYGLDPWEYKDSELVTLCEECHADVHNNEDVPVYRLNDGILEKVILTPCSRCGGSGYLPQYRHVQNGICFRCHGSRFDEYIEQCEHYAKEHDIDLQEFEDGYRPIKSDTHNMIKSVNVLQSKFDSDKVYLKIDFKDNKYMNAFLDFSVNAKAGDQLNISSLRVKTWNNAKHDKKYYILKGDVLRSA